MLNNQMVIMYGGSPKCWLVVPILGARFGMIQLASTTKMMRQAVEL
jgi:hypothetical protein